MKPILWLAATVVLAAGGAAVGWMLLPQLFTTGCPHPTPDSTPPLTAQHRFAMTPDDVKLDKETPAVALDAAGRVLLAWASQTDKDEYSLFLARSSDLGTTFSPPTVFRRVPIHRHTMKSKDKERVMVTPLLPRLAAHGDTITLGWLEPEKGGSRVRFLSAVSRDGGATFGDPVQVHGDDAVRPNFTAMTAGPSGETLCLWLDQRKGTQLPFCRVLGPAGSDTQAHDSPDGKGVCPCCDVDVVRSPDGATFAAFRNSKDGCRDIYVTRSAAGPSMKFEPAVCVTADHWTFDGCPHDAPSLAVTPGHLHVAWMAAHEGRRQVYLATSALDKLAFEPRRLGAGTEEEQGHPHLISTPDGRLHVVWDQALTAPDGRSGRAIAHACSDDDGKTFAPPKVLAAAAGAFLSRPTMACSPDGTVVAAWHEVTEEGKAVVFARLSPSVWACGDCCCGSEPASCCDVPSRGTVLNGK